MVRHTECATDNGYMAVDLLNIKNAKHLGGLLFNEKIFVDQIKLWVKTVFQRKKGDG